jgi:hypothetical protein
VTGSARSCAAALARFVDSGAQHIAVFVTSDDPLVQFEDLAGEFAGLLASRSTPPTTPAAVDRPGSKHQDVASGPVWVGTGVAATSGTAVVDPVWR